MIDKILESAKGKPCSCPRGKTCTGCKKMKVIKPRIYVEKPRRLPVPIIVSHYREKSPTLVRIRESIKYFKNRNLTKDEPSPREFTICRWYKRRKALRQLKLEHKKEEKRKREAYLEIARREREKEVLEQLKHQQRLLEKYSPTPSPIPAPKTTTKKVYKTGKSTSAKPKTESRYVTVKR
ncbi:uncharacterized protein ACR2FA_007540 [Aphomia sociella]